MITFTKAFIEPILLHIASYDAKTNNLVAGLLKEEITLGARRTLQKIQRQLQEEYKVLMQDLAEIKKECGEDKEKLEKEIKVLLEEEVKIDLPHISLSSLDNISSATNYDFEILDKIAK